MRQRLLAVGSCLGLLASTAAALAEPDRPVAGIGLYGEVTAGPTAVWLPALQTLDVAVDSPTANAAFEAPRALIGFGGELVVGMPVNGQVLGGGLRIEARGSYGGAEDSRYQAFFGSGAAATGANVLPGILLLAVAGPPAGLDAEMERELTSWSGEARVYLDYRSGDVTLSPFVGVYGAGLDQLMTASYGFAGPLVVPSDYLRQKDDLEQRFIGGQLGLAAEMALGERWSLGFEGRLAVMHASSNLDHQMIADPFLSREEDHDQRLALRADLRAEANYRFAGGIELSLGLGGGYLSDVATLDMGTTFPPDGTTPTRLAFGDAWTANATIGLTVPF